MRLRKAPVLLGAGPLFGGFNEAAAVRLRKGLRHSDDHHKIRRSFNEAAAVRLRKVLRIFPRVFRVGSLQRGRSREAAEGTGPWQSSGGGPGASTRPQP